MNRLIFLFWFAIAGPTLGWGADVTRTQYLMGTLCEIKAFGPSDGLINQALNKAFGEIARLDSLLSPYLKTSEVSRINKTPIKKPISCSPDTFELFMLSQTYWSKTRQAFDITLSGHFSDIHLDSAYRTVRSKKVGVKFDFGGIGKGYALDKAASVLKKEGIHKARLNFGGQILVFGPEANKWTIKLTHPYDSTKTAGSIVISNGSVSTSDQTNKHIVDPSSGQLPTNRGMVTVLAKTGTEADALSTAFLVLGKDKSFEITNMETNVCAIFTDYLPSKRLSQFISPACDKTNLSNL
ncbi:hypothetical protein BVX98_03445 [bacterium F11]|nr:hypothetical protein BVX98_03445 [bacterium F11]